MDCLLETETARVVLIDLSLGTADTHLSLRRPCIAQYIPESRIWTGPFRLLLDPYIRHL